jgi:two-component system response regulator PilR (NtrC family)
LERLVHYPFPGNVRELENILERAVTLAVGEVLVASDLGLPHDQSEDVLEPELLVSTPVAPTVDATPAFVMLDGVPSSLHAYLDAIEREVLTAALRKTQHNRTAAAQLLGISFRQIRYRMQRLGLL